MLWLRDKNLTNINFNWNEKGKTMLLEIDQDKARLLGIDSQTLAAALQTSLSGAAIGQFRQQDKTIDIVFRTDPQNSGNLARIKDLPVHIGGGKFVSLEQIAKISFAAEEGLIWRRDLKPTITVQADVATLMTGNDATQKVYKSLEKLRGFAAARFIASRSTARKRKAPKRSVIFSSRCR